MQMKVDAVVLDMDGLMLDTEPIYKAAWQRARRGSDTNSTIPPTRHSVGRRTEDCEQVLVKKFGHDFSIERFRSASPMASACGEEGYRQEAGIG
jgi:beta-phosphoglucomutase-like phosphatase (HAD superfamily)